MQNKTSSWRSLQQRQVWGSGNLGLRWARKRAVISLTGGQSQPTFTKHTNHSSGRGTAWIWRFPFDIQALLLDYKVTESWNNAIVLLQCIHYPFIKAREPFILHEYTSRSPTERLHLSHRSSFILDIQGYAAKKILPWHHFNTHNSRITELVHSSDTVGVFLGSACLRQLETGLTQFSNQPMQAMFPGRT